MTKDQLSLLQLIPQQSQLHGHARIEKRFSAYCLVLPFWLKGLARRCRLGVDRAGPRVRSSAHVKIYVIIKPSGEIAQVTIVHCVFMIVFAAPTLPLFGNFAHLIPHFLLTFWGIIKPQFLPVNSNRPFPTQEL